MKDLGRAIRYMGNYRRATIIAYVSLIISLVAQLMVPQLVQRILDSVANGAAARQLATAPPAVQEEILRQTGMTMEQVNSMGNPEIVLLWSVALIMLFAVARGLFSFAQSFMSESASQGVAFDLRNDLFAKIQRLSFSYHDRNRTGQLMIRATDDIEKVRTFIGQGLLLAIGAILLLVGALLMLLWTNWRLMLIISPVLPLALIAFMVFGSVTMPLFAKVQARLSALNTILQESLQGIKVVKAFAREPH
ncbi:MAG: ABC transporter transmembrane domain-containing protein, partial [Caldilineaceae bacterium]